VQLTHETHGADETFARSIVKTLSYRLFVLVLDFTAIYLFTHRLSDSWSVACTCLGR
jgi:hypothetical protein